MYRLKHLAVPLALLVGALGGYLAASGQLTSLFRATAAAPPGAGKEGDCCGSADRQQLINFQDDRKQDKDAKKPNIVIIWGDDIGQSNISAYTMGLMGYKTPNIDSIAREGMIFTDYYAEQSCTAG